MKRQSDTKKTIQVRIDAGWHYYAKLEAAKQRRSVKSLVEEGLEFVLGGDLRSTTRREADDPRL